jgi:hypothetical protein
MIAMRVVSILPARGLPERVFSACNVATPSMMVSSRWAGSMPVLATPLEAVSTIITTKPCEARNVPH